MAEVLVGKALDAGASVGEVVFGVAALEARGVLGVDISVFAEGLDDRCCEEAFTSLRVSTIHTIHPTGRDTATTKLTVRTRGDDVIVVTARSAGVTVRFSRTAVGRGNYARICARREVLRFGA